MLSTDGGDPSQGDYRWQVLSFTRDPYGGVGDIDLQEGAAPNQ
jgi:hypothetical protein